MSIKEQLTHETLRGLFKSNFQLAEYAIALAKFYIKSGREFHVDDLLDVVRKHPNPKFLEELQEMDTFEKEEKSEQKNPNE